MPPSKADMARRKSDRNRSSTKAHTRSAAKTPAAAPQPAEKVKPGGRLRTEVVLPVGVGAVVMCATLGLVAAGSSKMGAPLALTLGVAGAALVAGLVLYVTWVVNGAVARPLSHLRDALQEMEGGNYDVRLDSDGVLELCEVQQGFNRMATIAGHQRKRLKVAAATDSLTGLANHRHFQERVRADMQEAREAKSSLAVAALDIDGFRKLNDDRGHGRGDEALKAVADAIARAVRADDVVARLGGDDFVMILHGADPGFAREVTERARDAMARALPEELGLTVSAGFVCFPDSASEEGANMSELANAALDVAKRDGGNQTRKYDPSEISSSPSIQQQRAEIDALLAMDKPIKPVFQPLVELNTGRLIGFEALSRFDVEPQRSPDSWFNQAAHCGRGLALEMAAIKAALSERGRPPGTYLSLNFSPAVLASPKIMSILPKNMSDIVVEVTEHELASEDGGLEEGLAKMRARGARIAVDDAGAAYAGLNQVMRVQPDVIKLDRSLIAGVQSDSAKAALVEFFVMFARRVGAGVCTEGIETLEELRTLINLGVTYGQGYLLGRPSEPWCGVSPEITRALATGALRTHAPARPLRGGPAGVRPVAGVSAGGGAAAAPAPR